MKNIKFKSTISLKKIDDQLVTALEGGSNYWYFLPDTPVEPDGFERDESIHYRRLDIVYQGGSMRVNDIEDKETTIGELTMLGITNGLSIMQSDYPEYYEEMETETGDANTADIFFQLCLFGKLVYG